MIEYKSNIYYDSLNHDTGLKKTESLTCRLDKISLEKLRMEAEQHDISVNTLINQILKNHLQWHVHASKAGFISIRKGLLLKLLEKIEEDEIIKIANYTIEKDTKEFVLLLRNKYNIESALDVIETWVKIAGYPYSHNVDYDGHHYIIQHNMGRKWAIYVTEQYKFIFKEFQIREYVFDLTDNTLSFRVKYY